MLTCFHLFPQRGQTTSRQNNSSISSRLQILRPQNLNLRALYLTLDGASFVLNSYCTNISFYLVLKAKRIPAHNHPVIERLLTYRNVSAALSYS